MTHDQLSNFAHEELSNFTYYELSLKIPELLDAIEERKAIIPSETLHRLQSMCKTLRSLHEIFNKETLQKLMPYLQCATKTLINVLMSISGTVDINTQIIINGVIDLVFMHIQSV